MRHLVLCHEGAPMAVDTFAGPLRKIITEHPPDDVELWSIWEIPPTGSFAWAGDITKQFARTWAMELSTGATLEAHIAAAPAFVVHHARVDLVRLWLRRTAEADPQFIPVVLASARVAA